MEKPCIKNLEKEYPHIVIKVIRMWGSQECRDYLANVVLQERPEERQGFPFRILFELGKLMEYHDDQFPKYDRHKNDPWGGVGIK